MTFVYTLKEKTFFSFCFLVPPVKVYKKVVKFSFTQQKIFRVLVFSFIHLVSIDPMDRSEVTNIQKYYVIFVYILKGKMGKTENTEGKLCNQSDQNIKNQKTDLLVERNIKGFTYPSFHRRIDLKCLSYL